MTDSVQRVKYTDAEIARRSIIRHFVGFAMSFCMVTTSFTLLVIEFEKGYPANAGLFALSAGFFSFLAYDSIKGLAWEIRPEK